MTPRLLAVLTLLAMFAAYPRVMIMVAIVAVGGSLLICRHLLNSRTVCSPGRRSYA
jgi:hypothetical protein